MNEQTQTPKSQVSSSLQEMKERYGSVSVGHQNMKRSDGSEFTAYGLKFGKGPHAMFAAFSGKIANEDQSQRDEKFRGLNGVQIGQKVWANKDDFQALHKKDPNTGELLYRQNGEPILTICAYNDFTVEDAELA